MFGGTQGDYANPGLNGCVSASVLFPRRYYYFFCVCIWGRREIPLSLRGSPIQRLFGRLASSFVNIHPGIICLSGGRLRRSLRVTPQSRLDLFVRRHGGGRAHGPPFLSSKVSLHHCQRSWQRATNEKSVLVPPPPLLIFWTLFFNAGRGRLS